MNKQIFGKILMIFMAILILVLAMALILQIKMGQPQRLEKTQTEAPATPAVPEVDLSSRWATDSAVLEIEANLKKLSEELKTADLRENQLSPPILDMDVK